MGRKGVSKRKPSQTKSKPFSSDKGGGTVASAMNSVETTRSTDSGKIAPSADHKKPSKKA